MEHLSPQIDVLLRISLPRYFFFYNSLWVDRFVFFYWLWCFLILSGFSFHLYFIVFLFLFLIHDLFLDMEIIFLLCIFLDRHLFLHFFYKFSKFTVLFLCPLSLGGGDTFF